jgi:ADP-ribosylglycohydrolase
MKHTTLQLHRAAGVLLGAAAGDALGAGYEFTHPRADQTIGMIGGGLGGFEPGEWTDDTAMTVAVAEVTATGVDVRTAAGLDAVAANFIRWYDSHPKDIGVQTSKVLRRRDTSGAAMTATAAALPGRKGGNGSLMRTAPIGLAFAGDPEATAQAALVVSRLTHDDDRAHQACQLWSLLIEHTVRTGEIDTQWTVLQHLDPEAAEFWLPLKDIAETGSQQDFANNGWVVHALQTAWWAIHGTDDTDATQVQAALERAVRAGHDTDTTAAIAGALLGARWGASAIPVAWRRILHGWPGLRSDDLIRLALQTYTGSGDPGRWPGVQRMDYSGWSTSRHTTHPHDGGLTLGGYGAVDAGGYDAVVSLCRMGRAELGVEHLNVWLVDTTAEDNPNLEFVLDDTAELLRQLRSEGKQVLLHCVEGSSRTPSVAARYSVLLGEDPQDVRTAMAWAEPQPWLWDAAVIVDPGAR